MHLTLWTAAISAARTVFDAGRAVFHRFTEENIKIEEFRNQIQHSATGRTANSVLRGMLVYLDPKSAYLRKRPRVQEFYDKWLDDSLLRATEERGDLSLMEDRPALNELKRDADRLLK